MKFSRLKGLRRVKKTIVMEGIVALCMLTGICVVLPILVVCLNLRSKNLAIDKKAAVLMKAIENGMEVDPNLLLEEAKSPKRKRFTKTRLLAKLQLGVIASVAGISVLVVYLCKVAGVWALYASLALVAIGIGTLVAYFVGIRYLAPEIAVEEKAAAGTTDGKHGQAV